MESIKTPDLEVLYISTINNPFSICYPRRIPIKGKKCYLRRGLARICPMVLVVYITKNSTLSSIAPRIHHKSLVSWSSTTMELSPMVQREASLLWNKRLK
jgi:hypothetical protein